MATTYHTPYIKATLDGAIIPKTKMARITYSYEQLVGNALIQTPVKPSWAKYWGLVTIIIGASQGTAKLRFVGYLVDIQADLESHLFSLLCKGPLILATMAQNTLPAGTDMVNGGVPPGVTDQALVATMLDNAGLTTAVVNRDIQGTGKGLGTVATDQYWWGPNGAPESVMDYLQRLDAICLGYRTYNAPGGSIFRHKVSAVPASSAALTFTEGVDLEAMRPDKNVLAVKNRVRVTGYTLKGSAFTAIVSQASPFVKAPSGFETAQFSSQMIEKSLINDIGAGIACEDVGTWQIGELNRVLHKITATTPRDDVIAPGATIAVVSPIRTDVNANYFVTQTDSEASESRYVQELTLIGGEGSASPVQTPPVVDFTIQVEQELVVIAGVETTIYVVQCTSLAYGQSAPIATYAWSASGGGLPASGAAPNFVTSYQSVAGKTITLTVTDTNNVASTLTQNVPTATQQSYGARRLYGAGTTSLDDFDMAQWRVSTTGITAATIVANGPVWAQGDTVYASANDLTTAPTTSKPKAGTNVTALWLEGDVSTTNVLAGLADGSLAISTDGAATWTQAAGPDANSALRCVISRGNPNQWFSLSAAVLARTDNAGASWTMLVTAAGGETFRDLSVSFARIMVSMNGGRLVCDQAGTGQTLPAGNSGDIVAITAKIDADQFYCYDSAGHTYNTFNPGSVTFVASGAVLPAGGAVQTRGLWRDGLIPGLLYFAYGGGASGGVWKSVDGFQTATAYYQLRKPGVGNSPAGAVYAQIGLDGLLTAPPSSPINLTYIFSSWDGNTSNVGPVAPDQAPIAKALSLWNGASNNAAPANWQQVTFDDSGWAAAVFAYTPNDNSCTIRRRSAPPGDQFPEGIGALAGSPSFTAKALLRTTFTLPAGSIASAKLSINAQDYYSVWINNIFIGSTLPAGAGNPSNPCKTWTVEPSVIKAGQSNVIAVQVSESPTLTQWGCAYLLALQ